MSRFYPEEIPPLPHEPTSDRFAIRSIGSGVGQGVVALVPFSDGDVVFGFTGYFSSETTLFTLQVEPGLHLHDPYFMGKILHRCDPNCHVDMRRRVFIARRPIEPGDWVTMDYEQTEAHLFRPFQCVCGDIPCEGANGPRMIRGNGASRETLS